jgi:hypothetical protein
LRQRCRDDLYWFASVVLAYGDKIPMRPDVHGPLCRFLERKTGSPLLDTARYRKIEMPRETGKSVLARAYAIQRIVRDRNVAILLINEKELLAKDFLFDIKWQFENNQLFRGLFPEIIPPELKETTWSATEYRRQPHHGPPDPTIFVAGVGAALAGKHPTSSSVTTSSVVRRWRTPARARGRSCIRRIGGSTSWTRSSTSPRALPRNHVHRHALVA